MQYKVPQNVDIEDRVIGPLTLRQFIILLTTAGIILVLYFVIPSMIKIFFWLMAAFVGGLGCVIAFYDYGGQKVEVFLASAQKTFTTPRYRVWKKITEPVQTMSATPSPKEKTPKNKESLENARDDLSRLAELVDAGGYVSVDQKDRVIGTMEKIENEAEGTTDLLAKTEEANPRIEKDLKEAKNEAPEREPLVSEVASVSPDKSFDYPEIRVHK